jgi:membrane-bound lytic murein transglycosylase B
MRVAAAAGLLLAPLIGAAGAQSRDEHSSSGLTDFFTGSIGHLFGPSSPPSPAAAPGKDDWSGQSGASGHPLMQADAIRAAVANFPNCLAGYWPDAARRGVTQETFARATAGLTPDLKIMDLIDAQPEFTRALWDYLDMLVSDARIQRGREILAANKATFDAVERAYGVDRHVIAAIWGIESN